eukprot:jgi/Tetstr1/456215/TSEL_042978.t1
MLDGKHVWREGGWEEWATAPGDCLPAERRPELEFRALAGAAEAEGKQGDRADSAAKFMGMREQLAAAALAENVSDEKRALLVELLDEVLLPTEAAAVRAHLTRLEEAARLEAERETALAAAAEQAEAAQPPRARAAAPARDTKNSKSARARRAAPPAARDSGKPSRWNLPGTGGAPRRPPAPSTSPANKQPKPSQGASVKETATPSSRKAADAGRSSPSRPASGTRSRPACASPGRATGKNSRVKIFSGGAEDNVDKLYHRLSGVNDGILV